MGGMTSPILIMGTGALACLFAARLKAAGAEVVMLGSWVEGLEALRAGGVRYSPENGKEQVFSVRATDDPAECRGIAQALVLVKAWQTGRAASQLATCLASNGLALTLQNGLGNFEQLAEALGPERAALGVTTLGAHLLAPGRVRQAGEGSIALGEHPRLQALAASLRLAGFQVEVLPDPNALLWGKLVVNAAINPLTALLRVPNGELLHRPSARSLLRAAAHEVAAVAASAGVRLPFSDPERAVEAVAERTAANRSSMLRDVLRGAPTEIDAINGAIVRVGEAHGVAVPVNQSLWLLVKAIVEAN
jgi:2-dehydropantoate 2-reductase